jgi:hypothetical protein
VSDHVDIHGASGRAYRFMRVRDGRPLSPAGGNYLYGRFTAGRFEAIYAGEGQNLLKDARERWAEAVARHQASDIYTRLNLNQRIRQLEHADIVAGAAPWMNGAGAASEAEISPSAAFAGGGEDRVELAPGGAAGEGGEGPGLGDLPGRAQELAPRGAGQ